MLIEGPFGLFSSKYAKEREQVWIAGGIGITPFLSFAKDTYTNRVKLFWCINNNDEAVYLEELQEVAKNNPYFEVVIWNSDKKGYLTIKKMELTSFSDKAYFICGPNGLKSNLIKQLEAENVKREDIYDEEFAFR